MWGTVKVGCNFSNSHQLIFRLLKMLLGVGEAMPQAGGQSLSLLDVTVRTEKVPDTFILVEDIQWNWGCLYAYCQKINAQIGKFQSELIKVVQNYLDTRIPTSFCTAKTIAEVCACFRTTLFKMTTDTLTCVQGKQMERWENWSHNIIWGNMRYLQLKKGMVSIFKFPTFIREKN